jgi:ribosomal protein S18 acetylase RimI-like enzyme
MQNKMNITKANILDAEKLTELTIRSKSNWNYSPEQIEKWKEDLTITQEYIANNSVYKLIVDERLIGYYSFFNVSDGKVKLDNVFIEPEFIENGYGKILITDFLKRIESIGFVKVTLDSDPNAETFYERLGFKVVGKLESSIQNRFLPIMEMEILPAHNKK